MNIPEKVKIGGETFIVNIVDRCDTDDRNCDGQILYGKNRIELLKELKGDYLDRVLIHEIVHGIYQLCGFEQNENEVDRLSRALHMVIVDNPEIFKL